MRPSFRKQAYPCWGRAGAAGAALPPLAVGPAVPLLGAAVAAAATQTYLCCGLVGDATEWRQRLHTPV